MITAVHTRVQDQPPAEGGFWSWLENLASEPAFVETVVALFAVVLAVMFWLHLSRLVRETRSRRALEDYLLGAEQALAGDHAGANSCSCSKVSGVNRCGSPPARSDSQIRPTASKASACPDGDAVCQRRKVASNGPSSMRNSWRTRSEIVRWTRASNGTAATCFDATSSKDGPSHVPSLSISDV